MRIHHGMKSPLLLAAVFGSQLLLPRTARCEPLMVWSQRGPALAPPAGEGDTAFGASAAISGDTAVVGSPTNDVQAPGAGAAYVYTRTGNDWVLQGSELHPPTVTNYAGFGYPCAIDGNSVLCASNNAGVAYSFERTAGAWSAGQPLLTTDPAPDWTMPALSVSGDFAFAAVPIRLIGTPYDPPAAYVLQRNGSSWQQTLRLELNARSVSVSGDTAAIAESVAVGPGQVHLFERTGNDWQARAQLLQQPDASATNRFGRALALDGDTLLVASDHPTAVGAIAGAVYVFTSQGGSFSFQVALEPAEADETFGSRISLSGNVAAIAAKSSAYFFERTADGWRQAGPALDTGSLVIGFSVSGQYAILGALGVDRQSSGSATIYSDACASDQDCPASAQCVAGTCRARCGAESTCGAAGAAGAGDGGDGGASAPSAGEGGSTRANDGGAGDGAAPDAGASSGGVTGGVTPSGGAQQGGTGPSDAGAGAGGEPSSGNAGTGQRDESATSCGCRVGAGLDSSRGAWAQLLLLSSLTVIARRRRRRSDAS